MAVEAADAALAADAGAAPFTGEDEFGFGPAGPGFAELATAFELPALAVGAAVLPYSVTLTCGTGAGAVFAAAAAGVAAAACADATGAAGAAPFAAGVAEVAGAIFPISVILTCGTGALATGAAGAAGFAPPNPPTPAKAFAAPCTPPGGKPEFELAGPLTAAAAAAPMAPPAAVAAPPLFPAPAAANPP